MQNLCVSVIGGIQPDMLKRLRNLTDDGLLQRFVPVILQVKQVGSRHPYAGEAAAYAALITLATSLPEDLLFTLDVDAQAIFAGFNLTKHTLETTDTLSKGFRGFAGKLDKVFGYLCAGLLVGDGNGRVPSLRMAVIDGPIAARAVKIMRNFVVPHAYEVYGITTNGAAGVDTARALASFILTDRQKRMRHTTSDFISGVHDLRGATRAAVFDALAPLIAGGWFEPADPLLRKEQRAYSLNDGVREHFEARRGIEQDRKEKVREIIRSAAKTHYKEPPDVAYRNATTPPRAADEALLGDLEGEPHGGYERVATHAVFDRLGLRRSARTSETARRLARVMRHLGWRTARFAPAPGSYQRVRGFERNTVESTLKDENYA